EVAAEQKERGGKENEGECVAALALVKAGSDEQPELQQDHRRGHEETREERHLHVEKKWIGELRVREFVAMRQELCQRLLDLREDDVRVMPAEKKPDENRDDRDEQPFAKFLEVVEKRHLREFLVRHLGCCEAVWCGRVGIH